MTPRDLIGGGNRRILMFAEAGFLFYNDVVL